MRRARLWPASVAGRSGRLLGDHGQPELAGRQALNNLVNGRSGISPEMAVRLSKAFGGSAEVWLRMQLAYDLAEVVGRAAAIKVRRVPRPKAA